MSVNEMDSKYRSKFYWKKYSKNKWYLWYESLGKQHRTRTSLDITFGFELYIPSSISYVPANWLKRKLGLEDYEEIWSIPSKLITKTDALKKVAKWKKKIITALDSYPIR